MKTRRMSMTSAKTPFDEIPICELDLPIREYNALMRCGIRTVRAALNLVQQDDSRSVGPKLIYLTRQALEHYGYLSGAPLNYHSLKSFSNRLAWLAETQDRNGLWGHSAEHTIGAALSFIRAGHTSVHGEYAITVDRAVKWLERTFSGRLPPSPGEEREYLLPANLFSAPLHNSTTAYGLLCVLAENYDMPRPVAPFEPPLTTDFKSVIEARRWALLVGNAPLYGWQDGSWNVFYDDEEGYSSNHQIEFAWMTVGAPRQEI